MYQQIQNLIRNNNFTVEEAAKALGLDVSEAQLIMMKGNSPTAKVSLASLREDFLPEAFKILKEVAQFGERDCDKIKACQIIIQGEGVLPENIGQNSWAERFAKARQAREAMENNIIDLSNSEENGRAMVLAS